MTVQRWRLHSPARGITYTVPINPREMTSPHSPRRTAGFSVSPIDLAVRARREHPLPHEWAFSGVIRTQEHHDTLRDWCTFPEKVQVTDHLNRTFSVRMVAFEPTERRPTPHVPWRYTYMIRCYVYEQLA